MIISDEILEKTCKDMIETILLTLDNATKGTIYLIGPMPELQAIRVTSGIRIDDKGLIQWGLPEVSDYNYIGKTWKQYRDEPGRVLEAMGWCVEGQKSWTADDPYDDLRSVRKQLRGEIEDFHHMEPVLVRKTDLYGNATFKLEYPLDHKGMPIWQDTEYIVAAVVKIHFRPFTIRRGDRSTKIIKKLSLTLGTELLSLHIRETLSEAQKDLARQRLQSCNVLAHELRNTLVKLGFIFSAINAEISYLREQWELHIESAFPELDNKKTLLSRLSYLLSLRLPFANGKEDLVPIGNELLAEQQELAVVPLMPQIREKWLRNRVRPRWKKLLTQSTAWDEYKEEIEGLLDRLQKAVWLGKNQELVHKLDNLPDDLKITWPKLAYTEFSADKLFILNDILQMLDHPALNIPHKRQTKKILTSLRALAEMIPEVEERANRIISSLRNGKLLETF
ncbi:MAG: hypothetical protein AB2L11_10425 [Syntrophobacteraceae bacterium]